MESAVTLTEMVSAGVALFGTLGAPIVYLFKELNKCKDSHASCEKRVARLEERLGIGKEEVKK